MTFFLNSFGAMLLSVGFLSYGLFVWDMNRLPHSHARACLAWVAAVVHSAVSAAWVVNGYAGGQTGFGRLVQEWQWIGRACGGAMIVWTVILGYRQSAADRAEKRKLLRLVEG